MLEERTGVGVGFPIPLENVFSPRSHIVDALMEFPQTEMELTAPQVVEVYQLRGTKTYVALISGETPQVTDRKLFKAVMKVFLYAPGDKSPLRSDPLRGWLTSVARCDVQEQQALEESAEYVSI